MLASLRATRRIVDDGCVAIGAPAHELGRVPKARTFHVVVADLDDALEEAGLPMHQVNVTVNGGSVRLWGWIDSETQRQAARAAVESTPGVRELEDNLVVASPALRAGRGYV